MGRTHGMTTTPNYFTRQGEGIGWLVCWTPNCLNTKYLITLLPKYLNTYKVFNMMMPFDDEERVAGKVVSPTPAFMSRS
jgi:hypothetical protein